MRKIFAALASFCVSTLFLVGAFYLEHQFGRSDPEQFSPQWAFVAALLGPWPQVVLSVVGFTWLHFRYRRLISQLIAAGVVIGLLSALLLTLEHGEWLGMGLFTIIVANSVVGAILYWALGLRGAGPNNSFKPNSLRESA